MGELRPDLDEQPIGEQLVTESPESDGGSEAAEYVQELIRRMGGDPNSVPVQPTIPPKSNNINPSAEKPKQNSGSISSAPASAESVESENYVQRIVSKSRVVDSRDAFMKFREAANLTTKDAFQKFSCKRLIERAYVWLFLTCFFIINTLVARQMGVTLRGMASGILHVSMSLALLSGARFLWLTYIVNRGLIARRSS